MEVAINNKFDREVDDDALVKLFFVCVATFRLQAIIQKDPPYPAVYVLSVVVQGSKMLTTWNPQLEMCGVVLHRYVNPALRSKKPVTVGGILITMKIIRKATPT
jgi:hypothetical protein